MKKRRDNGEGTIYFIEKEQLWRAEIVWFDQEGNAKRKTWKGKKQSEVKAKLTEFKKQLPFFCMSCNFFLCVLYYY